MAAAAGAGEARLSLAEVMQRWQRDSEAASPEQVRKELDPLWEDLLSADEQTAGRALIKKIKPDWETAQNRLLDILGPDLVKGIFAAVDELRAAVTEDE